MIKQTLFLSLMLVGCGRNGEIDFLDMRGESHSDDTEIEAQYLPYVSAFETLHNNQKVNIKISSAKLEETILGVCYTYSDGYRQIKINTEYWPSLSEPARDQLIKHELGHCILGRPHDNTMIHFDDVKNEVPKSIMYMYGFGDSSFYSKHLDHYNDELFNGK